MTDPSIRTVSVDLPNRAYQILIGPGVLDQAGTQIAAMTRRSHVTVITDETVDRRVIAAICVPAWSRT
ncbi:MAG: hypothetical protein AAFP98_11155, partial [Pseudomonadota bacterium]